MGHTACTYTRIRRKAKTQMGLQLFVILSSVPTDKSFKLTVLPVDKRVVDERVELVPLVKYLLGESAWGT